MSLPFQILATAGARRRAVMDLPHRQVQTPVFMPVGTVGSVKAVPQHLLEAWGTQIILGNTYPSICGPDTTWCGAWVGCTAL